MIRNSKSKDEYEVDKHEVSRSPFSFNTAVPIETFRIKLLIKSFAKVEEFIQSFPLYFREVPQNIHNFLFYEE